MKRMLKWIKLVFWLFSNRKDLLFNHELFQGITLSFFHQLKLDSGEYQFLAKDLLRLAELITPYSVSNNCNVVRIGSVHDGGYVLIDDLSYPAVSIGIGNNTEFDHGLCVRGSQVFQFDHTIKKPPTCCDKPIFFSLGLAGEVNANSPKVISLGEIVEKCKLQSSNSAILKIDIEGGEWSALSNPNVVDVLRKFRQVVIECHNMQNLFDASFRREVLSTLENLNKIFFVMNYHGNNFLPALHIAGLLIPQTFELTFVNRELYSPNAKNFILQSANSPNNPFRREMIDHLSSLQDFLSR